MGTSSKTQLSAASIEEIEALTRNNGEVRGASLCADAEYIRHRVGEKMLRRVELVSRELGTPIDYRTIEASKWYPASFRTVSLYAITKALGWDDEELREMGKAAPKYSIATKIMLRYFVGIEEFAEKLKAYWLYNYSRGSLSTIVIDRSAFVCLRNFWLPPILSIYVEGSFMEILSTIIGKSEWITVRQTERWHMADKCHDFVLRW